MLRTPIGRFLPLLLFGILSAGAIFLFADESTGTREAWPSGIDRTVSTRIAPSEVTLSNLDAFEEQFRDELPIGTSKEDVEAYLTDLKIVHSFADPKIYSIGANTFYATIENIGSLMGLPGSLAIEVHLGLDGRVDNIAFRVDHFGP